MYTCERSCFLSDFSCILLFPSAMRMDCRTMQARHKFILTAEKAHDFLRLCGWLAESFKSSICLYWKWGIPRKGYLIAARYGSGQIEKLLACRLIEWQPAWLSSSLVWLNDSQDGCPVYWFDWVAARMAVQFTGLIEWQLGWLVLRMGWQIGVFQNQKMKI